jgi:hypothetical protein
MTYFVRVGAERGDDKERGNDHGQVEVEQVIRGFPRNLLKRETIISTLTEREERERGKRGRGRERGKRENGERECLTSSELQKL